MPHERAGLPRGHYTGRWVPLPGPLAPMMVSATLPKQMRRNPPSIKFNG